MTNLNNKILNKSKKIDKLFLSISKKDLLSFKYNSLEKYSEKPILQNCYLIKLIPK